MLPLFLSIKSVLKASKMIFYILLLTVIHVQMAFYVNAVYLNQKSKPGKEIYDDYELTNFFECFCKCKNSAVRFLPAECKSYMNWAFASCCRGNLLKSNCLLNYQRTSGSEYLCPFNVGDNIKKRVMEEEHRRTLVNYPKTTEIPDLTTESKPRDIENCLKDLNESFIVFLLIPTIVIIIFAASKAYQIRCKEDGIINTYSISNCPIHPTPLNLDSDLDNRHCDTTTTLLYTDACPPYEAPPTYDEAAAFVCPVSNTHQTPIYKALSKSKPVAKYMACEHSVVFID